MIPLFPNNLSLLNLFKAKEDSAHCGRQCCPRQRGLKLNVYDTKDGSLAMVAHRSALLFHMLNRSLWDPNNLWLRH